MSDLFIVQNRLRFSLKLTGFCVLLGLLATWWFHKQLEFEVDNHQFLFAATLTAALLIGWLGLLLFYVIAKHFVIPGYSVSDRIDEMPWGIVKMVLMLVLIGAGWFMIARYADQAGGEFDLLVEGRLEVLEERIRVNPALLRQIDPKTDQTLVQMAFRHGDPEAVTMLLAQGAAGGELGAERRDPLVESFGEPAMLTALLDGGFDPDRPDAEGIPPLHYAVAMGATNVIAALLDAGGKVDVQDRLRRTPLMRAIENDDLLVAGILLERGADLDARDQRGDTSLHKSTRRGGADSVEFLLKRGADPKIFNFGHMTPLHLAAAAGDEKIVDLLLATPGVVDLTDDADRSPLDLALKGRKYEIVETLIEAGADVNRAGSEGDTLLRQAVLTRDYRTARVLIGHGAAASIPNRKGETALDLIREKELTGLLDQLEAMESKGADGAPD